MPRTLWRITWPVANLSPGSRMFRIRMSQPSTPTFSREDVHDTLHGELRLVAAEAAHGTAVGVVGVHGLGLDVHVRHAIGTAGVARGTKRALGARGVIAARVSHDPRAHGGQPPLGIGAHGERDRHGMSLDVVLRGLFAREHRLHGPSQQVRRQRRLRLNRQLFLRAEGTTARGQHDLDAVGLEPQDLGNLQAVVHRPLAVGVNVVGGARCEGARVRGAVVRGGRCGIADRLRARETRSRPAVSGTSPR